MVTVRPLTDEEWTRRITCVLKLGREIENWSKTYLQTLESEEITPEQFDNSVRRLAKLAKQSIEDKLPERDVFDRFRKLAAPYSEGLEQILLDDNKISQLFKMEPHYLRQQYDEIIAENRKSFVQGTLSNLENIQEIVFYAILRSNNFLLARIEQGDRTARAEIINHLNSLGEGNQKYNFFSDLKLNGIMSHGSILRDRVETRGSLAILYIFDAIYQRLTGDASIFDISISTHLERWKYGKAHNNYWKNWENVKEAVYHTLNKVYQIIPDNREQMLKQIGRNFPETFTLAFQRMYGLNGIIENLRDHFGFDNPTLGLMTAYDQAYMEKTKEISLLDKNQAEYAFVENGRLMVKPHN